MKSLERFYRARHLEGALAKAPVKGLTVREAHDELTKLTDELTRARDRHMNARGAARESAARVRDATAVVKAECKKGRGALIAKGVDVDVAPEGASRQVLLERSEQLVARGRTGGVKLAGLETARDGLSAAIADLVAARKEQRAARRSFQEAAFAWDGGYSALRAIVEGTLRRTGLRSEALEEALTGYFPSSVERSSSDRSPRDLPPSVLPSLPASGSMQGPEGTKAA